MTSKHVPPIPGPVDFEDMRMLAIEGHMDDEFSLTSVADIAAVAAGAIDYQGEWPVYGGISGTRVTFNKLKEIGEKVRGKKCQRYSHFCIHNHIYLPATSYPQASHSMLSRSRRRILRQVI